MKFPFMKVPKQQPVNLTKADDLREQIFPRGRGAFTAESTQRARQSAVCINANRINVGGSCRF